MAAVQQQHSYLLSNAQDACEVKFLNGGQVQALGISSDLSVIYLRRAGQTERENRAAFRTSQATELFISFPAGMDVGHQSYELVRAAPPAAEGAAQEPDTVLGTLQVDNLARRATIGTSLFPVLSDSNNIALELELLFNGVPFSAEKRSALDHFNFQGAPTLAENGSITVSLTAPAQPELVGDQQTVRLQGTVELSEVALSPQVQLPSSNFLTLDHKNAWQQFAKKTLNLKSPATGPDPLPVIFIVATPPNLTRVRLQEGNNSVMIVEGFPMLPALHMHYWVRLKSTDDMLRPADLCVPASPTASGSQVSFQTPHFLLEGEYEIRVIVEDRLSNTTKTSDSISFQYKPSCFVVEGDNPQYRFGCKAVHDGSEDVLYVLGGTHSPQHWLQAYQISTKQWRTIPMISRYHDDYPHENLLFTEDDAIRRLSFHTASILPGTSLVLVLFGLNAATKAFSNGAFLFDMKKWLWHKATFVDENSTTVVPTPRAFHSAVVDHEESCVWMFGGCVRQQNGGEIENSADIFKISLVNDASSANQTTVRLRFCRMEVALKHELQFADVARWGHAMMVQGNQVVVVGGQSSGANSPSVLLFQKIDEKDTTQGWYSGCHRCATSAAQLRNRVFHDLCRVYKNDGLASTVICGGLLSPLQQNGANPPEGVLELKWGSYLAPEETTVPNPAPAPFPKSAATCLAQLDGDRGHVVGVGGTRDYVRLRPPDGEAHSLEQLLDCLCNAPAFSSNEIASFEVFFDSTRSSFSDSFTNRQNDRRLAIFKDEQDILLRCYQVEQRAFSEEQQEQTGSAKFFVRLLAFDTASAKNFAQDEGDAADEYAAWKSQDLRTLLGLMGFLPLIQRNDLNQRILWSGMLIEVVSGKIARSTICQILREVWSCRENDPSNETAKTIFNRCALFLLRHPRELPLAPDYENLCLEKPLMVARLHKFLSNPARHSLESFQIQDESSLAASSSSPSSSTFEQEINSGDESF